MTLADTRYAFAKSRHCQFKDYFETTSKKEKVSEFDCVLPNNFLLNTGCTDSHDSFCIRKPASDLSGGLIEI